MAKTRLFCSLLCAASVSLFSPFYALAELSDSEHKIFLEENTEYFVADKMLNLTWKVARKSLSKKAYKNLQIEQRKWLLQGRDEFVSNLQFDTASKATLYMVATVARTQELTSKIWQKATIGTYKNGEKILTIQEEDGKLFVQAYALLQANNPLSRQMIWRAELGEDNHLWHKLHTVTEQTVYILTANDCICIAHDTATFLQDFNGIYTLQ